MRKNTKYNNNNNNNNNNNELLRDFAVNLHCYRRIFYLKFCI